MNDVFILGGAQTDFARNIGREDGDVFSLFGEVLGKGLDDSGLDASEIEVGHVGNFAGELFCGQGHLGGFFAAADPRLDGMPSHRHEAACASGSMAILAAMADLEARRYGVAAVLGIEIMRNVPTEQAALNVGGPAMWSGRECVGEVFAWPQIFGELGQEYERRYGLNREHLTEIAKTNFANAKRNPNAQTRTWTFTERSFMADDETNPFVGKHLRRQDCGQMSDGAAIVFLAGKDRAQAYADHHGLRLDDLPRIAGWGHRCSHMSYAPKIARSADEPYVFPHVRRAALDAFGRAGLGGAQDVQGFEVHDCFTTTEYMAIDHLGITAPGESWKAVEEGVIKPDGATPVNPSGGLIGLGHPVGATGVRMLLDCAKQVTGRAGEYQVPGAKRFGMLNIGGSTTTAATFIVEAA